jgi:hypothetical protein
MRKYVLFLLFILALGTPSRAQGKNCSHGTVTDELSRQEPD